MPSNLPKSNVVDLNSFKEEKKEQENSQENKNIIDTFKTLAKHPKAPMYAAGGALLVGIASVAAYGFFKTKPVYQTVVSGEFRQNGRTVGIETTRMRR